MAYEVREWQRCPGCRTLTHEWFNDDGRLADPPPMTAMTFECPGCAEQLRFEDEHELRGDDSKKRGLRLRWRRWRDGDEDSLFSAMFGGL